MEINIVHVDPQFFAHLVAVGETAVAICLIFGLFSNLTYLAGLLLALVIWSTAEGFGGPYVAGSTDVGTSVIYGLVYVALFLSSAGLYLGVDRWLTAALGRWGFLASGQKVGTGEKKPHERAGVRPGSVNQEALVADQATRQKHDKKLVDESALVHPNSK